MNNKILKSTIEKLRIKFLIFLFPLCFVSCDGLDIESRTSLDPSRVTAADVETLLNGCYHGACYRGGANIHLFHLMQDYSADNLTARGAAWGTSDINQNNISTSNANIARWWNHSFVAIERCNNLLNLIKEYDESLFARKERKTQVAAEARAIRAWVYFRLVTTWGGVPIREVTTLDLVSRNTEEEVWTFIENELAAIVDDMPDFHDISYTSKASVNAFIARVALIRGNNARAAEYSDKLIKDTRFTLATDYGSIWRKESQELIQQWQATVQNPLFFGHFLSGSKGRYEMPVDITLVEAYEAGDLRKDASVGRLPAPINGFQYECAKYYLTGQGDDPWPVFRIAEQYLIQAEALGYPNGVSYLNTIRNIRGLPSTTVTNQNDFLDAVLAERRVELAFEGHRWTDLKRTGKAHVFLPNIQDANDTNLLYPLPISAIDVNANLEQNPGYY